MRRIDDMLCLADPCFGDMGSQCAPSGGPTHPTPPGPTGPGTLTQGHPESSLQRLCMVAFAVLCKFIRLFDSFMQANLAQGTISTRLLQWNLQQDCRPPPQAYSDN
jgi:hypothetical protein